MGATTMVPVRRANRVVLSLLTVGLLSPAVALAHPYHNNNGIIYSAADGDVNRCMRGSATLDHGGAGNAGGVHNVVNVFTVGRGEACATAPVGGQWDLPPNNLALARVVWVYSGQWLICRSSDWKLNQQGEEWLARDRTYASVATRCGNNLSYVNTTVGGVWHSDRWNVGAIDSPAHVLPA